MMSVVVGSWLVSQVRARRWLLPWLPPRSHLRPPRPHDTSPFLTSLFCRMSSFVKSEPSTPSMSAGPSSRASVPRSAGAFRPKVKKEEAIPELDADGGANFSDYKLVSNGQGGWNYNVIKFHSSANAATDFDPLHLPQPALLNRKDPRPRPPPPPPVLDEHGNVVEELKPVLDEKGKPMLGPDGKVMFATGKKGPTADLSLIAPDGGAVKNRKNLFKKKTKQIFKVSQDRMRLRREERHPWVLEGNPDGQPVEGSQTVPGETWVGRMEDTGDKSFVMFVFEDDKDEFQIMDVRRWYKFQQRPTYNTLNQDEAEEMVRPTHVGRARHHLVATGQLSFPRLTRDFFTCFVVRPHDEGQGPSSMGHAGPNAVRVCPVRIVRPRYR